uniref:KOW domain-containing protein n=2 Tax=Caenorhabditis japonica TaxID=281687 RepID=A0A8R1I4R3_CAEJA
MLSSKMMSRLYKNAVQTARSMYIQVQETPNPLSLKFLPDVRQRWLETVIPREIGEKLMIVSGKRAGKLAEMVDKDKRKEKVTARLLATNDIVTAYFEDVCAVKIRVEDEYE